MIAINAFESAFLRPLSFMAIVAAVLVFNSACASLNSPPEEISAAPEVAMLDEELLYKLLAAEFAGNAGDLDSSVDYYLQAAYLSEDGRITARAAYIALYNKQYPRVLELLARWRELEPENPDIDRMYAISYLQLHQPVEALPYVQSMLAQVNGSHSEKAMAVKELLGAEVEAEDALVLFEALNQAQADNPQMLILQARFALQLEQHEASISLLDRALEIEPSLVDVHLIKAQIYLAQGDRDRARAVLAQVLEERPDDFALRMQYARLLVEDRAYEAASEQYRIVQQKQPDNAEVSLNLALLYIEIDQLDKATRLLEHLLELDQKTDIAYYYLGRIAQNREQYKAAIAQYIQVKEGPFAFEARLRVASLFAQLDRADEAIEQLQILAQETDEWAERVRIYLTMGEIYRSNHRYKESFEMFSRALAENSEDIDLLYARALIAEKVNRVDVAEADLLKVLSMEPDNADALNALGYTLADRTERYQEARDYIQRAIALVPEDPAIMDSLGWVNYRMGELPKALKWLSRAFDQLADAEIAAHYGEVLWQAGEKDKARKVWQKGQEANARHPVLMETLQRFKP
ncbi:MAG: tetratricopeptide repeat protein [Gammaproteobacteria bacterium]|nr:tetratricopeptide repeat protein [Gammaproteobacteria bacterium]